MASAITPIYAIQGTELGPAKEHEGEVRTSQGVITHIERSSRGSIRGFFIQDAEGDNDDATSDGLYVKVPYRAEVPELSEGNLVTVTGEVSDGTRGSGDLPKTTIELDEINVDRKRVALPQAVRLGHNGREIAGEDLDAAKATLAALDGMRVEVLNTVAVGPSGYGVVPVVADSGEDASGLSPLGVMLLEEEDLQPEVLEVRLDPKKHPKFTANVGDKLGKIVGPLSWRMGGLRIDASNSVSGQIRRANIKPEVTDLVGTETQMTVATFNLYNVDPHVEQHVESDWDVDDDIGDGSIFGRALQIVDNLRSPDVIAVQEVQDDSGADDDGKTSAQKTAEAMIEAIVDAGGPRYEWVSIAPKDNEDGGQPGGNIRVGYFYNPERVSLRDDSVQRLGEDSKYFDGTRKSLEAAFVFNGKEVSLINNHFASKRGSSPSPLTVGHPTNGQEALRTKQAELVNARAEEILADNPDANVVLLGDMNEYAFKPPIEALEGKNFEVLTDPNEHSYIFAGRAGSIDHFVVPKGMKGRVETDTVHVNTLFADQKSDHDPKVMRISFE